MAHTLVLRGIAIGFTIAAPIGPVGILCIRRALSHGRRAGVLSAAGAALADCLFGAIVGLSIGIIPSLLSEYQVALRLVGGVFLIILGGRLAVTADTEQPLAEAKDHGWFTDFVSSFAITATNPGTLLGVIGVFAAMGPVGHVDDLTAKATLVGGIFLGSLLWWTILSSVASALRCRVSPHGLQRFGVVSGLIVVICGAAVLGSLIWEQGL